MFRHWTVNFVIEVLVIYSPELLLAPLLRLLHFSHTLSRSLVLSVLSSTYTLEFFHFRGPNKGTKQAGSRLAERRRVSKSWSWTWPFFLLSCVLSPWNANPLRASNMGE
jgi:hypothetical protein